LFGHSLRQCHNVVTGNLLYLVDTIRRHDFWDGYPPDLIIMLGAYSAHLGVRGNQSPFYSQLTGVPPLSGPYRFSLWTSIAVVYRRY
jgi:hypothetical protein